MYTNKPKVNYQISYSDYQWILTDVLNDVFKGWKAELFSLSIDSAHSYDKQYIECLLSIMGILNCALFLGGYNKQLQLLTAKTIMPIMLEFLEISYVIYELYHVAKKNQKVTLQVHFTNNLNKLLKIEGDHSAQDLPL